jgi:hypothetical protein
MQTDMPKAEPPKRIRRWFQFSLALLSIIGGEACPSAAAVPEPLPKGTLSGSVVGPDAKPVAAARIAMADFYEVKSETTSDAKGHFSLGPLEAEHRCRWDIRIDADGFATEYVPRSTYSIFPGSDCDLGAIRIDRGRVFSGQVLDVDGKPRADAAVEYGVWRYQAGHGTTFIIPTRTLTTDAEGRFRTPPLPVGFLELNVNLSNRLGAFVRHSVRPGGEEALKPIRLEKDVPIAGLVRDEQGRPIEGATIDAQPIVAGSQTSDSAGRFTLHGYGPKPWFVLMVSHSEFVPVRWSVVRTDDGFHFRDSSAEETRFGPLNELAVVMQRPAWIEGQAIDAATGKSVRLTSVELCYAKKLPNGQRRVYGCALTKFQQPETGHFRVPYGTPWDYHLVLSAAGYHDADAFTSKPKPGHTVEPVVVKMTKISEDGHLALGGAQLVGTVTREGRPIKTGWIGAWTPEPVGNRVGVSVTRGRTIEEGAGYASAPIRNGAYTLDMSAEDRPWYLVVEEAGQPSTQVGSIHIAPGEQKKFDIVCTAGGEIRGCVLGVPHEWAGHVWIVAFTKTGIPIEKRADADGQFRLIRLAPGEYGLKAGHDAFKDSEILDFDGDDWFRDSVLGLRDVPKELDGKKAEPWKRAKVVKIEAGQSVKGIEIELPPE